MNPTALIMKLLPDAIVREVGSAHIPGVVNPGDHDYLVFVENRGQALDILVQNGFYYEGGYDGNGRFVSLKKGPREHPANIILTADPDYAQCFWTAFKICRDAKVTHKPLRVLIHNTIIDAGIGILP